MKVNINGDISSQSPCMHRIKVKVSEGSMITIHQGESPPIATSHWSTIFTVKGEEEDLI